MITRQLLALTAAAGLALTPIAAQAGTRAGQSTVSAETALRAASPISEESEEGAGKLPFGLVIALLASSVAVIYAIIEAIDDGRSLGTGN